MKPTKNPTETPSFHPPRIASRRRLGHQVGIGGFRDLDAASQAHVTLVELLDLAIP